MENMEKRDSLKLNEVTDEEFEKMEETKGHIVIKFGEEGFAVSNDLHGVSGTQLFDALAHICKHFGFTALPFDMDKTPLMAIMNITPDDDLE